MSQTPTTSAPTTPAPTTPAPTTPAPTTPAPTTPNPTHRSVTRHGSCHCGAVKFEVELEPGFQGSRCNCSICMKIAQTGVVVKPSAFKLVAGEESLGRYSWGMKVSTRHFCKHCGIQCFGAGHLKELGGDFVSPNLNCLDDVDVNALSLVHWDGRHDNWMAGPRSTPWPLDSAQAAVELLAAS